MPKTKKTKKPKMDSEYEEKRAKNNAAVQKSRAKAKAKATETQDRIDSLKRENDFLEEKKTRLAKELSMYKEIFMKSTVNT